MNKCPPFRGWFLVAATLVVAPGVARAQEAVAVERFQPAPGPRNFLSVETARVDGDLSFSFGMFVDYARDPFPLHHCLPGPCDAAGAKVHPFDVVENLVTANLLASFTPLPRLQLGLRVPFAYVSGQGVDTNPSTAGYGEPLAGGISGVAMGDPALEVKVRALGSPKSLVAGGISTSVSAPIGHATSPELFVGDGSPVGTLRGIVDVDFGRLFVGYNAGGALRSQVKLGTLDLGPEFRAGAGAGVRVTPRLNLLAEGFGSTNFTTSPGTNAAEADAAAQLSLPPAVITLGGGAGLNRGIGAPLFRVLAGASVFIDRGNKDDPDLDHDGIPNEEDRCPREGGDVVRVPGKYYGCPKRDSDGDGVLDFLDACPDVPGVKTQDPKTNGCPDDDRDHDGIPNDKDKCPDQPETYNGFQDADGCPDQVPIVVEVKSDQIMVNETINFEFNSDRIVGDRSFEALDLVALAIKSHPEIRRLEVAGHTDNVGSHDANVDFSNRRAAAVVAYLISKGVEPGRLVSHGYGPDKPVASNENDAGRALNRRVQFNILMMFK